VQANLDTDVGNLIGGEVVEPVDVVHDTRLVRLSSGKYEQVLEVLVVAKGRRLQDDLLQQLDQLRREIGIQEARHGLRNLGGVRRLGNGGRDDLVNHGTAVQVVFAEDKHP